MGCYEVYPYLGCISDPVLEMARWSRRRQRAAGCLTSAGRNRFGTLRGSGIGAMQNACFPTGLSDAQWRTILPHLPKPAKRGRPRTDPGRILDAVADRLPCLPPLARRGSVA